ncbi:MAG: hypothetical protein IPO69_02500 [Saprospiraceae bacterium]|nr:hypothetical protein [Saprospiraceae bacterium]
MLRLTDVVKQLLIINAILFVVSILPLYQYMPDLSLLGIQAVFILSFLWFRSDLSHVVFWYLEISQLSPGQYAMYLQHPWQCGRCFLEPYLVFWLPLGCTRILN